MTDTGRLDRATAAAQLAYLTRLQLAERVADELAAIAEAKAARAAAKAAGLRLYAGKPCPRDHGTDRRVSDGKCPQCAREATRASMRKRRGRVIASSPAPAMTLKQRLQAITDRHRAQT